MTQGEIEYLQEAISYLKDMVERYVDENQKAIGRIYDRLTTMEIQLGERKELCLKHDRVLDDHSRCIGAIEGDVREIKGRFNGVPERLWNIGVEGAQTSASAKILLKIVLTAGGIGGAVASIVSALLRVWSN